MNLRKLWDSFVNQEGAFDWISPSKQKTPKKNYREKRKARRKQASASRRRKGSRKK